ncbi:hypothetical protein BGX26_010190 [Mortierella sp. AD094]|nr:hypothetical protein BGX26_010190 [Mortierella sp. AD094]
MDRLLEYRHQDMTQDKYADPDYIINFSGVGGSVSSCTEDVTRSTVHTDLPTTNIVEDASGSRPTEDYLKTLLNDWPVLDDFEDVLNRQKDVKTIRIPSSESPTQYQFNLFDTPGLNDTYGEDEAHVASIYKALRDAGHIHLVLIAIGKAPFTPGFQAAIKCYFDMFREFHGIVAFVHTHFDYKYLHTKREEVVSHFTAKKGTLNKMMGRDAYHFEIDCDIKSTSPIRIGITQNIIRRILSLAPFNQPVAMNRVLMMKSPKMKDMGPKVASFGSYEMETQLTSLRSEERDLKEYIKEYNASDLVMIHESTFHESWRVFQLNKDHSMDFPNQEHIIHKKNIFSENVEICEEQGGEDHPYWSIVYK